MKKYIISLILLIFIGCGQQDSMLKVTFVDDCQNKLLNDKVTVKITKIGDGKIFVYELEQIHRIRTGETDQDAL